MTSSPGITHHIVYQAAGRYAGWPANYGIWSWANEIVVGFWLGYTAPSAGLHQRSKELPAMTAQARSHDGGRTWQVQPLPAAAPGSQGEPGQGLSGDEHQVAGLGLAARLDPQRDLPLCPGEVDFTHPYFALMCARTGLRAGAVSWFYLSTDRCHTWQGPYRLPDFDLPGIAARTDYLVDGPRSATLWLTAAKSNGEEGRVFCCRTEDGGRSFRFLSWVGPEPAGFSIMPATVRLSPSRLLTAVRVKEPKDGAREERNRIDLYRSEDNGVSWIPLDPPAPSTGQHSGNPPALIRLQDGRLCLVYGVRAAPYSICARLSPDGGESWSAEIVLRQGAGDGDLGYVRAVQCPDGAVVAVYYWNDRPDGERYIAATAWQP